jgi:hypothetical protein
MKSAFDLSTDTGPEDEATHEDPHDDSGCHHNDGCRDGGILAMSINPFDLWL